MKVVINRCWGDFGLSEKAIDLYYKLSKESDKSKKDLLFYIKPSCLESFLERNDPILIKVVEELGSEVASGPFSELKVVEIPDDVEWEIFNNDGKEVIREVAREWY